MTTPFRELSVNDVKNYENLEGMTNNSISNMFIMKKSRGNVLSPERTITLSANFLVSNSNIMPFL